MSLLRVLMLMVAVWLFSPAPVQAALAPRPAAAETAVAPAAETAQLSAREKRQQRKALRQDLRQRLRDARAAGNEELALLIILAILLPPLAMYLYEGDFTTRFWISLVLTLLGAGLIVGVSFLGWLPAVAYTLYIILTGA
jgi:uncharacterized membrane protein YqaE (UPF0057 family)